MALVKVRRSGNSLAVTIPVAEARAAQVKEGMYVSVEADERGLRIEPVSIARRPPSRIVEAARQAIAEEGELLERLAEYDRAKGGSVTE